jgi:hypothetical protein
VVGIGEVLPSSRKIFVKRRWSFLKGKWDHSIDRIDVGLWAFRFESRGSPEQVEPIPSPVGRAHSTQKSHVGARDLDMMLLAQLF